MIWWLSQNTRLEAEKAALTELEGRVDWLKIGKWLTDLELAMSVEFRIDHGGKELGFQMRYPSIFPDAPPMIYTADRSLISYHQYGANGELCLEHRPDNWHSAVTGAQMVESCHRLIVEEQPETGEAVHARSAHVASLGRDLRSKYCRFLLSASDLEAINALPERSAEVLALSDRKAAETFISSIRHIGTADAPVWTSDLVLPKSDNADAGFVVRAPGAKPLKAIGVDDLRNHLDKLALGDLCKAVVETDGSVYLLIGDGDKWQLFWIYGDAKDRKIIPFTTVNIPANRQRLPQGFESLVGKKVGIVGCGSVGSKIAASLCRSGLGRFLLIDEDIFFPGNVVRNDLDLRETGAHKANAVRDRLTNVNPSVNVSVLCMTLGGQESANSMTGALEALGDCDLLIDATAEPTAFNMIASVATRQSKPMVWAEVFAGGIGGFVARARPYIDPVPLLARAQIEAWCTDQNVDWIRPDNAGQYDGQGEDGAPLIADDAEVSIVASHVVRFACDILARPDAGIFPVSAYVIGFSSEWLFTQPFDTRPIDLVPDGVWGEQNDGLEPAALIKIVTDHMPTEEAPGATDPAN
jgi:molybdopterin/thiamine biosynthesis adenylyltransferase/ubiquitin-protein ligase